MTRRVIVKQFVSILRDFLFNRVISPEKLMSFGQKNAGGYYFGHGYCNSEVLNEQILNFRLIFDDISESLVHNWS